MIIQRDHYLKQLIDAQGNGLIKIVTGIRRCGKSFLLSKLFRDYLENEGVARDHIIHIPLDDRKNAPLRDPDALLDHLDSLTTGNAKYYILLDEIQLVEDFVGVLNSLLHNERLDVYVTGSNSKFLSKDIATEFRGRGQEIHMFPLSFAEYYSATGGDKSDAYREYYTFGGLPQILSINGTQAKREYLSQLDTTVYLRDILERNNIRNSEEFEELLKIIASSIGAPCNPTKLSNTFKSLKNITIYSQTIANYLSYAQDAFLVEKALRYNIKGKKYINTLAKYYFSDMGLRNAFTDFRQIEETHLMENVIYNELRMRGFQVDAGSVEAYIRDKNGTAKRVQYEIDFVANQGDIRYYIQSALDIPDDAKMAQETESFNRIDDSFKKVLIVGRNIMPYRNAKGYLIIGIYDFLLHKDSLAI
ncbi:MAG: ATP-binding protein [Muribaculaceae bacterium]|nr:ATP-binding protein [Muribaculaceae bacterium]